MELSQNPAPDIFPAVHTAHVYLIKEMIGYIRVLVRMGPSIKYVTLFFANLDPLPLSHFVTHPGTPQKSTSHISDPPFFSRPSTKNSDKNPLYKFSLNCSRGFFKGYLVWKVLLRVIFVRPSSVRIYLLQQKVKHHLKFQVSYV